MIRAPIPAREPEGAEDAVEDRDAPGHVDPDHVVLIRLDPLADHVVGDLGQDEGLVDRDQDQEDRQRRQGVASAEGDRRGRGGREAAEWRSWSWSHRPAGTGPGRRPPQDAGGGEGSGRL